MHHSGSQAFWAIHLGTLVERIETYLDRRRRGAVPRYACASLGERRGIPGDGRGRRAGGDQALQQRFDAIIVQPAPAHGDGIDLCSRLRRGGLRAPIIVLSEVAAEQDVIGALNAGANDYVVKPFRLAELKARLRAQIRQHETSDDAVLAFGPYHFCPGARYLHEPAKNRLIRLTHKEAAILKCLYRATGRPVSRQTLLLDVWSYSSGGCPGIC
jgi:DNA-binding response OmpR family regulator